MSKFTILRDPVERTVSDYYHLRRAPDHPFHEHALRLSLAEYCVHPATRHLVENYQANYLAKAPCDPLAAAQGLSENDLARFSLQERMHYPDRFASPQALLESAQARLASFATVGITEDFERSLGVIGHVLNCPPLEIPRLNVNPDAEFGGRFG